MIHLAQKTRARNDGFRRRNSLDLLRDTDECEEYNSVAKTTMVLIGLHTANPEDRHVTRTVRYAKTCRGKQDSWRRGLCKSHQLLVYIHEYQSKI